MENIEKMLRKAVETADLRKKETLRLIKVGEEILQKIAIATDNGSMFGNILLEEDEYDSGLYLIASNGDVRLQKIFSYGNVDEQKCDATMIASTWKANKVEKISRSRWIQIIWKIM